MIENVKITYLGDDTPKRLPMRTTVTPPPPRVQPEHEVVITREVSDLIQERCQVERKVKAIRSRRALVKTRVRDLKAEVRDLERQLERLVGETFDDLDPEG